MERGHSSFLRHIWSQGLCRGELLFMEPRIICGSKKPEQRTFKRPLLHQTYCLFRTIAHGFVVYCCRFQPLGAAGLLASKARLITEPHPACFFFPQPNRNTVLGLDEVMPICGDLEPLPEALIKREAARRSQPCARAGPHTAPTIKRQ